MAKASRIHLSDLAGFSSLGVDGVTGVASIVEAMHDTIARGPGIFGPPGVGRAAGIPGLVYGAIRGTTRLVGLGVNAALAQIAPMVGDRESLAQREAMLAAVNGAWGDYLAATGNPLAIPMRLRSGGRPLELDKQHLASAMPRPGGRLLILAHGLCVNDLQWTRQLHNHGAALERDLGYTAVYLHYNSGLHVSTNGRAFADLMEALVANWPVPVEDLTMVTHSMGGLVARSAYYYGMAAGHRWPGRLRKTIFLGAPHHGSPLERLGNLVDLFLEASPYSAPLARPGKTRSAGVTDLRYGNLLDEDWEGSDRFAHRGDVRRPVALPDGVECYAIAGVMGHGTASGQFGDGLVPLDSALGRHRDSARTLRFDESRQWIGQGVHHLDLLSDAAVYDQIRRWLEVSS
jgi:hypothetical protein